MFVRDCSIGCERLGDVDIVDVVDSHFGRDVCGDGFERKGSCVDHHLSVEGCVERVARMEMNGIFAFEVVTVV